MIPVLFEIGPIKVYSYGLMLGIAFLLGNSILSNDLKRKNIDPAIAGTVTILAVVFGIAGAKLLHLIEHWSEFVQRPVDMAFSAGGLTWYGGFIVGIIAVSVYVRSRQVPFLRFLDSLGIALILAYGVGRIGCHLSGDGDYGFPTDLPWGTNYENGTCPPSCAFRAFPEMAGIPDTTPCHPTPVYELLMGLAGFGMLWKLRTRGLADGKLFMIYLMLASLFRFLVEFLRLNPRVFLGLSEAQLIAGVLFVAGVIGFMRVGRTSPGGVV